MDPLSLVTNLITVTGAATTISNKLKKVVNIRHLPEQVLQLANEVSDFRCVLASVNETLHRLNEINGERQNTEFEQFIKRLLERGIGQLEEIDKILDDGLILNYDTVEASSNRTIGFWEKWLKKQGNLQKLSAALRSTRRDMYQALTVITASEAPSVRVHLNSIASMQNEAIHIASEAHQSLGAQVEAVTEQIRSIKPSLDRVQNLFQQNQFAQERSGSLPHPPLGSPQNDSQMSTPTFKIRTAMKKSCNATCMSMQELFSRRLASPFDTSSTGWSLLDIAVVRKRLDMCKLLLAESADPYQEGMVNGSPIDKVWQLILQDPLEPLHQGLKRVFELFMDPDLDLQSKRFSVVHQCVLGLTKVDLEQYLQLTTAEIDSPCAMGSPPLFWAASSSNLSATATLLNLGARTDLIDLKGQNLIHFAVEGSNVDVLKIILMAIELKYPRIDSLPNPYLQRLLDGENGDGWTPLTFAASRNKPNHVMVLLNYRAALQKVDDFRAPALLSAARMDSHATLEILLKRGARTNVKSISKLEGILHIVAMYSNIQTFQILQDYKVCCLNTTDKTLAGLTPLQLFDTKRQGFINEDEPTFFKSRRVFLGLLDSIERRVLEHGCLRNDDVMEHVDKTISLQ